MDVIRITFDETERFNKSGDTLRKTVYEYNIGGSSLEVADVAYTQVSGRYPETGWSANGSSTMLYYLLDGEAVLTTEAGKVFTLSARDILQLPPQTWYCIKGTFQALMICTPPWRKEQSLHKSDKEQSA